MRSVYAVQFEVDAPEGGSPASVLPAVIEKIEQWVIRWYGRKNLAFQFPQDGEAKPLDGHTIRVDTVSIDEACRLWELAWSHPSENDDALRWVSNCVVAQAAGRTEVFVGVRIESVEFRMAPLDFELGRPRVVRALAQTLRCRCGDHRVLAAPTSIRTEAIADFVQRDLLAANRRLPVIVFSRDGWSETPVFDPALVADKIVGLARVYILRDKWAAFALTRELGRKLSCFDGAVRIYWPGLKADSEPYDHPLFLPELLRRWEALGRSFSDVIFRRLAPISAYRFVEGDVTRSVRREMEAHRRQEETARRAAALTREGEDTVSALKQELADAWEFADSSEGDRKRLEAELREVQGLVVHLQEEREGLREENEALKASFAQVQGFSRSGSKPRQTGNIEQELKRVTDAVLLAERQFSERLTVWPSAKKAATKSAYARPDEVFQALLAIREVLDTYFLSKDESRSMGSWEEAFKRRGFKYAAKESQNTLNMFGEEREFSFKGTTLKMQKHLTLGGGDRQNCLQIYFEVDNETKKAIIGYCGVHLRYWGMTT